MDNEPFDEMSWIKNYFDGKINYEDSSIESIRNFTLLWNMFEAIACNKMANISSVERFVDHIFYARRIQNKEFTFFLDFVQHRYIDEFGNIKSNFYKLNFRSNDKQELVEKVLKGEIKNTKTVLKALLFIALRLRNNLLHGEKGIVTLDTQEEYFNITNRLIAKCLDLHKEYRNITIRVINPSSSLTV